MRKRRKLSLSSSSPSTQDPVEENEELIVFPSENNRPSSQKTHLLKPCFTTSIDGSEAVFPSQHHSASSPDLKSLTSTVFFNGWREANKNFKSWARKMAALHEPTWRKAGIFEAVMASTYKILRDADLLMGLAEKWCPDTKTFVFPWGETTITLEDVMVLLGFSVLGSPVFAALDSSGEETKAKLEKESLKIRKYNKACRLVTQVLWMRRFMDSGDELEHVSFLALWLSYFVFPSRYYDVHDAILPISVHLSNGTRIALAPAVLAHLYADLSLLKSNIRAFSGSTFLVETDLTALFKLVQVWTWERFRELQPRKTNPLRKGEPRLALWHKLKQRTSYARRILDNSKIDSFEWRPYTKTLQNWEFPQFYPEKGMWVPVGPNLDDQFVSFARCTKVSELVGLDSVEQYFPNRVASQFGMLQDVPCPVNRNNLSPEAAWNDYTKPIDDLTLYIPSRSATPRVSPLFCELWRKSYPEFQYSSEENRVVEAAGTSTAGNIVGDNTSFVPFGSKMSRTSEVGIKVAEDATNKRRKCMKRARDKICNYMKLFREDDENTVGFCQTHTASDNDEDDDHTFVLSGYKMNITSEDGMKIAKHPTKKRWQSMKRIRDKRHKYMKRARDKIRKYMKRARDKIRKYMKRACENDESTMGRCKTEVLSDNDEEDDSLTIAKIMEKYSDVKNSRRDGFDGAIDIVTSPPETRQYCDDELDVYESNVEKMTTIDDGSKEPECFQCEGDADNASSVKCFHELKVWASSIEERINKAMLWLKERRAMKQRKIAAVRLI